MLTRTTLHREEAKAWGLVHEIKAELFEISSEILTIQLQQVRNGDDTGLACAHSSSVGGGLA